MLEHGLLRGEGAGSGSRHNSPASTPLATPTGTPLSTPIPSPAQPLHKDDPEFVSEVNSHLSTLQTCLTTLMGQPIAMEQLKLDVGHMVDKMTQITIMFRRIKLKMEEYVCLKVYILLNKGTWFDLPLRMHTVLMLPFSFRFVTSAEVELESIQERYVQVLRSYLQNSSPQNPQARLSELLSHIPEVSSSSHSAGTQTVYHIDWLPCKLLTSLKPYI